MAFAPIPEYEGKSPYVFMTYAQQDEKTAYPIAVKMFNEGFRIWSSAACGNPSNMRIAERLSNSEVAIVFLSKSYLKYASYNEFEPRVVMSSPKPKIVICLDDTPIGSDWNTVDFPAGIRYNPDIPQELWLRINSSDTLEKCRGAWPSRPMPLPFESSPTVNISVDADELSGELNSLNSVMTSFGAGLDEDDIKNITLFQKKVSEEDKFEWHDKRERTQEQEYYAIENLIDTSPMPVPAEKKQYDNMIGLIENFMEKSNRIKENELRERISSEASAHEQSDSTPDTEVNQDNCIPVPLSDFENVDMSDDVSDAPVVLVQSDKQPDKNDDEFEPIVIDYGDSEPEGYSMTRNTDRFTNTVFYPSDEVVSDNESKDKPVFEKIVDDRKLITSTEDNAEDARLTYHLGMLDNFDENNYIDSEQIPEPQPEPQPELKDESLDNMPVRFTDDDKIPLPALKFDKPAAPEIPDKPLRSIREPRKVLVKYRKRWRVAVRTRINHIEYGNEMYKVNGRWIPGEIYHAKMPNAEYTEIKDMSKSSHIDPVIEALGSRHPEKSLLTSDSRLSSAVNTFRSPHKQEKSAESIPETVKSVLRERRDLRRAAAISQLENQQQTYSDSHDNFNVKNSASSVENEPTPSRKFRFSHDAGIKKSLMLPMTSPVVTDADETHRQYGSRAEIISNNIEESPNKKNKKKKSSKSTYERDDDALIAIPTQSNQPKINYNPSAYRDMNISEILFSDALSKDKEEKPPKKKKKK